MNIDPYMTYHTTRKTLPNSLAYAVSDNHTTFLTLDMAERQLGFEY